MKIEPRPIAVPSELAGGSAIAPHASRVDAPAPKAEPGAFAKLLAKANEQVNAHEHQVQSLAHGGQTPALGPEELLALQSDVYRYSATVDLASKLVAQGTQGVQTVLKGGGQ